MEASVVNNKRTLKEHPQYFGTYLNMARHNIFLIQNHIAQKYDKNEIPIIVSEEHIADGNFFNKAFANTKQANSKQIFNAFVRHIPVAKIFDNDFLPQSEKKLEGFVQNNVDFNNLGTMFKKCFKEINEFRNNLSHFYHIKNGTERKLYVSEDLKKFVNDVYEKAVIYTEHRFKDVFKPEHFGVASKKELINLHQEFTRDGLVFFCCLFLEKEYAFHFINRIIGFKGTQLPDFLATREVYSVFCVKLPHNRFISEDPKQAYILDVLNYLHRCPQELYQSLSEESKKNFQPTLSIEAKENIQQSSINSEELPFEDYDEYIKSITTTKRNTDRFAYFALKYLDNKESFKPLFHLNLGKLLVSSYKKLLLDVEEDRFIYDSFIVFGKLDDYLTSNVESTEEKEIKVKKKFQLKKGILIEQYAPKYHIVNNKIAINLKKEKLYFNGYIITQNVEAFLSIHELPKLALLEYLKPGVSTEIMSAFIDNNYKNIFNEEFIECIKSKLLFENVLKRQFHNNKIIIYNDDLSQLKTKIDEHINFIEDHKADENKGKQIENRKTELKSLFYNKYVKEVEQRKLQLYKVLKPSGLNCSQIPERIINYWLQIEDVKDATIIKNKIKEEKDECKLRLKDLANQRGPKIGEMASFLAKDIIRLIIEVGVKKKITSFYYDRLQECLALYADIEKQLKFKIICSELFLSDQIKGHPFLNQVILSGVDNTKSFYKKYLELKGTQTMQSDSYNRTKSVEKNWIYSTFYNKQKNSITDKFETTISMPAGKGIPYSYKQWQKPTIELKQWIQNITKGVDKQQPKPVDLPTDIFDKALADALIERLSGAAIPEGKARYTYLLSLWMPKLQAFYAMPRTYKVYEQSVSFSPGTENSYKSYYKLIVEKVLAQKNKEIDKDNKTQEKKKPKFTQTQILSVFNNAIAENEKLIRFYETKDRILLLLLEELSGLQFDLVEMDNRLPRSPLNELMTIKESVHGKTITATRKRKEHSVLKKLVSDKRLKDLLNYYEGVSITYETLNKELRMYNICREQVFDTTFKLETKVVEKLIAKNAVNTLVEMQQKKDEKNQKPSQNIQFDIYIEWLKQNKYVEDQDAEFIKTVRNKFMHNEYACKEFLKNQGINIDEKTMLISEQIYKHYMSIIERIIQQLTLKI